MTVSPMANRRVREQLGARCADPPLGHSLHLGHSPPLGHRPAPRTACCCAAGPQPSHHVGHPLGARVEGRGGRGRGPGHLCGALCYNHVITISPTMVPLTVPLTVPFVDAVKSTGSPSTGSPSTGSLPPVPPPRLPPVHAEAPGAHLATREGGRPVDGRPPLAAFATRGWSPPLTKATMYAGAVFRLRSAWPGCECRGA